MGGRLVLSSGQDAQLWDFGRSFRFSRNSFNVTGTVSENGESVIVEVSGARYSGSHKLEGTVRDHAGKNLSLLVDEEIAEAAMIRVQTRDMLFLGEVLLSVAEPVSGWTVHVRVKRTLAIL